MQQDGENLNIMIHRQMGGRLADQPGENQAMQKIIFHFYPSFTNMIFPPRTGTGTSRRFDRAIRPAELFSPVLRKKPADGGRVSDGAGRMACLKIFPKMRKEAIMFPRKLYTIRPFP